MTDKAPEDKPTFQELWNPRPKTKHIAFGFYPSPDDPNIMLPHPEMMPLLIEALLSLEAGLSLREVAEWINPRIPESYLPYATSLSHMGLSKIWARNGRTIPKTNRPGKIDLKGKPPSVQKVVRRRKKISSLRNSITAKKKQIAALGGEIEKIEIEAEKAKPLQGVVELDTSQIVQHTGIKIFEPNPGPQTEFLASDEQELLYGGAAGGGKSYAMLADPIRYFSNKNFNGLLLRRTNDELRELKWKSRELYDNPVLKGVWREKDSMWKFPSGAQFWLTYLERDEDVMRYQGQSFSWIGIDELTQYATPFAWNFLRSRLRSIDPELPEVMRATSNPGGPGHGWVKRMFFDPAPPMEPFWATNIETGEVLSYPSVYQPGHPFVGQPHPQAGKPLFQRKFIPAKLYDNPYLTKSGSYEASLLSLPEDQRRQLLEGDWTVATGAAFSEFRTHIHVVKPFTLDHSWRRFRSCDYGYSSHSAVHWYAVDEDGNLIVYRELYCTKKTAEELAEMILEAERGEKISYGVLDSSTWNKKGDPGPSIAEAMISKGCRWRPSDRSPGSRVNGKNRLHELLKVSEKTGRPGIIFFDTCRQIIADLPVIPSDPNGGEDINDKYASDHAYDSIRYGIMTRPHPTSHWELNTLSNSYGGYTPFDATFGY